MCKCVYRYVKPSSGGWRDIMATVKYGTNVFEIQIAHLEMVQCRQGLDAHQVSAPAPPCFSLCPPYQELHKTHLHGVGSLLFFPLSLYLSLLCALMFWCRVLLCFRRTQSSGIFVNFLCKCSSRILSSAPHVNFFVIASYLHCVLTLDST